MEEEAIESNRQITSADIFARARDLRNKANENRFVAETTEDKSRRQLFATAATAYAEWANGIEKIAVTIAGIERSVKAARERFQRPAKPGLPAQDLESRHQSGRDSGNSSGAEDVWLFAYGTLQQSEVQSAVFGRVLDGQPDALLEYILLPLKVTDPAVIATSGTQLHTIAQKTGNPLDIVPGLLFRITKAELAAADAYEVADCKRVNARLKSGIQATVYVCAGDAE